MTVFWGSAKFWRTSFTKPSSFPSEYSTQTALLFKSFKLGEAIYLTLLVFLTSSSWALGKSLNFRKASSALINLYFFRYSCARGITTSQMTVTPDTKNGFLLKKSSMDTRICSMLIFCETWSASAARVGKAKETEEINARAEEATWRSTKGVSFLLEREAGGDLNGGEVFRVEARTAKKGRIFRVDSCMERRFGEEGGWIRAKDLQLEVEMWKGRALARGGEGKRRGPLGFGMKRWSGREAIRGRKRPVRGDKRWIVLEATWRN